MKKILTILLLSNILFGSAQDTLYSGALDTVLANTVDTIILATPDSGYLSIKYKASSNGTLDNRLVVRQRDTIVPETGGLIAYYSFNGQNSDDSTDTYDATPIGSPEYENSIADFCSWYMNNNTDTDGLQLPSISYGNTFSITAWFRTRGTSSEREKCLFTTLQGNDGFEIGLVEGTLDTLYLITGNGVTTDTLYTSSLSLNNFSNHHYVVTINRTLGSADIYVDGTDVTGNGSIRTDFENASIARALIDFSGNKDATRTVDNLQVYNFELTSIEASTLYNGGSCTTTPIIR